MELKITSKFLVTSFMTSTLLATFDNLAGLRNSMIYSFFHIEIDELFYRAFDRYSFVKVDRSECESYHPSINIIAFIPQKDYTNQKMEMMFCEVLREYAR